MVSTGTFDTQVGVVVVAIFVVLVFVYMLYRYLRRRGPELAARESKSMLDDRAYNQIQLGQAAAARLAATGVDVTQARELLNRAEVARTGGNYGMSIELSKKAQDFLAAARAGGNGLPASLSSRSGPSTSLSGSPRPSTTAAGAASAGAAGYTAPPTVPFVAGGTGSTPEAAGSSETASDRPPKNKMEAHFQLSLAQDELDQARATRSRSKGFREANELRNDGQAAYDRQDYTEALRLALKCRRTLGTRIEGLPVSTVPTATGPAGEPGAAGKSPGPASEASSSGPTCPQCGQTAAPVDQFCRACGAPIRPVLCMNCGAPLRAGDRFCGKCGATQT